MLRTGGIEECPSTDTSALRPRWQQARSWCSPAWLPPIPPSVRPCLHRHPKARLVHGRPGDRDLILGRGGSDKLDGGDGRDLIHGGAGGDRIIGGPGNDGVRAGDGRDVVIGGRGDDKIDGGAGPNKLVGGLGFDVIYGGEDHDRILGGRGNDTLHGADGEADRLCCGPGEDSYTADDVDCVAANCENDITPVAP